MIRKKQLYSLVIISVFLFSVSLVSALSITLNSPTDGTEYDSTSVNLNVNFDELVSCNYTLYAPIPPDSSGGSHLIFKLIPSYTDNPENYQASPIIGYTDNYNFDLDLKRGYDYTFTLRCINQEGIQVSKEISFSTKDECIENWECSDWINCNNFGQTSRTCTDANNCNDRIREIPKPSTSQSCTIGACIENWQCGSWSECTNNQQTRTCTDENSCGTINNKPEISRSCSPQNGEEATCGDLDGLNYFTKGETIIGKSGGQLIVTDLCLKDLKSLADQYPLYQTILNNVISEGVINSDEVENENILIESYCPSNIDYTFNAPMYQKSYICLNGCFDGACLEESEVTTPVEKLEIFIKGEKITIETPFEVVKENSKVYIKTSEGNKEIKILPGEAITNAKKIEHVKSIEIKEEKGNIVYSISGTKKARLFFIFSVSAEVRQDISIEDGEIVSTKRPWWHFFAFGV